MTRMPPPIAKTPPPPPGRVIESAARDAMAWWPGEKFVGIEDATDAPYQPGPLAWFLTLLAGAVIGATVGPWVPLWP